MTVSFYFRHFLGFFIQIGAGVLLCQLPFGEAASRFSKRSIIISTVLFTLISSAFFPVFIGNDWIAYSPYQALAANLYMTVAILLFLFQYFWTIRVEMIKKLIVLVLALFYAATQYILIGVIESLLDSGRTGQWEVYMPIDLLLYAVTAALMLPPCIIMMKGAVREYLEEIEIERIHKEFRLILALTFLYFVMLVFYSAGPAGLIQRFWMWIIPPMVMTAILLGLFYWNLFRDAVRRKRENDERRSLEIQKLQYENINHEMERMRRQRHDMHHSLNYLSELLTKGDDEAVKEYLSEWTTQITHRENTIYCKNVTVNGLLQYYVGMAADQNIKCQVQADCGELQVSAVDLTVMLGNMMENAIRVCTEQNENWITVEIGVIGSSLLMQITNPSREVHPSGRYRMDDSFLPAAAYKSDRLGGGHGLRSLEHAARKYDGDARFCYNSKSKTFTSRVRLNLNQE